MDLTRITPHVNLAARYISRSYSQVTYPDVAAVIWLWVIENESKVEGYIARPDGVRILRSIFVKEARKYATKERAVMTGLPIEDTQWYTPNAIRAILPDVFDHANWQSFNSLQGDGRRATPMANATGDRVAALVDVKKAVDKLIPMQREVLELHYGNGESIDRIATRLAIEPAAARKRLDRAVYAVRDLLGGPRPGDPYEAVNGQFDTRSFGRKAVSNAAARSITDNNWSA